MEPSRSLSSGHHLACTERVLKSEQIGLSSHKTFYTQALEGNWQEERIYTAFDWKKTNVGMPLSTTQDIYRDPSSVGSGVERPRSPAKVDSVPKPILFGHGTDLTATSFVTMNDLTLGAGSLKPEVAMRTASPTKRNSLVQTKQAQWSSTRSFDPYATTNRSELVAHNVSSASPPRRHTTELGEFTHSLNSDTHKIGLRGGVVLTRTPLINKSQGPHLSR